MADITDQLRLPTTLVRRIDGKPSEWDVVIVYEMQNYELPSPKNYFVLNRPPEQIDCAFVRAEFNMAPGSDEPTPLTDAEIATLEAWFYAHSHLASDHAGEIVREHLP